MKTVTLIVGLTVSASAFPADKIEIKSGVNTTYCVPFHAPQCQAYNARESQALVDRRRAEERLNRLERERELERLQPRGYDQYQIRGPYEYRR